MSEDKDGFWDIVLKFKASEGTHLYYSEISVTGPDGSVLKPVESPRPTEKFDSLLETNVLVITGRQRFRYRVPARSEIPFEFTVSYQGCDESKCFLPVTKSFSLRPDEKSRGVDSALSGDEIRRKVGEFGRLVSEFTVAGRLAGYLSPAQMEEFLDHAVQGGGKDGGPSTASAMKIVWWLVVALVGGLALNLTPCVLPMIPINIAIIGGGVAGASRLRGFILGGAYGLGMAAAYGLLGLLAVIAGVRFGTLNSSPLFNAAVAILFVLLALAMFGVFNLDLSRYQSAGFARAGGRFGAAFAMGAVAATLAGACVAPVVVSTLLLASQLYASGRTWGLALPFFLGVGMALPWPLAGAGLALLPKPGQWMNRVKYIFGLVILAFAVWYGWTAFSIAKERQKIARLSFTSSGRDDFWIHSIEDGLEIARREGKPVFIDFWASWCKTCGAMERTTFQDEKVRQRLSTYVRVKYQAENPRDPATKAILDVFGVSMGLPTYVVLIPRNDGAQEQ